MPGLYQEVPDLVGQVVIEAGLLVSPAAAGLAAGLRAVLKVA